MQLIEEQKKQFVIAAEILKKNMQDTEQFKERTSGITNGDSDSKKQALADLLKKNT